MKGRSHPLRPYVLGVELSPLFAGSDFVSPLFSGSGFFIWMWQFETRILA
jgi:hypothetical protein